MVKTSVNNSQMVRSGNCYILYDASLISKPNHNLFDSRWLDEHAQIKHIAHGRGEAWFVDYEQQHWVLRRYMRGGLVARFNKSHYFAFSISQTRAWKEWHLLAELYEFGLPVPRPIAAQICWRTINAGFYQAYLLLEKITGAETLSQKLQKQALAGSVWMQLGALIRSFHDKGVYHADLNANNILFDELGKMYLIDFDRGEIRTSGRWKQQNLLRLQRSLNKLKHLHADYYFTDSDWQQLLMGYG